MGLKNITKRVKALIGKHEMGATVEKNQIRDLLIEHGLRAPGGDSTEDAAAPVNANAGPAPPTRDLKTFLEERNEKPNLGTCPRGPDFAAIAAFQGYRERERGFVVDLATSKDLRNSFFGRDADPRLRLYPACHMRFHLEMLWLLLGAKPCVMFMVNNPEQQAWATHVVLSCLVPVVEEWALEKYGFALRYIGHDVRGPSKNYKMAWLLADTRSEEWPLIKEIYLRPNGPAKTWTEGEIGRSLGYPSAPTSSDQWETTVAYKDDTERAWLAERFSGTEVCCVDGMDYHIPKKDEEGFWQHYVRFGRLAALAGVRTKWAFE